MATAPLGQPHQSLRFDCFGRKRREAEKGQSPLPITNHQSPFPAFSALTRVPGALNVTGEALHGRGYQSKNQNRHRG
jgi:hypothetical protein